MSRDVAAERDALQETIDRLYGLPLDEFTPARDAAVKERRGAKDRDGAETLRQLRKPNLVAWSLNRVRRSDPTAIDELIAAGERLREAQRLLIESGEHGSLRDAAADERAHARHVAQLASAELSAAGRAPDAGTQTKLFATLHAAAASSEVRERLAGGRLLRDHELSDLGFGDAASVATPPRSAPKRAAPEESAGSRVAPKRARSTRPDASARARERKRKAVSERLARARERQQELAEEAERAGRAAQDAERAARQAAKELTRAESAAGKAARTAERATTAAARAEASVSELQAELAALS